MPKKRKTDNWLMSYLEYTSGQESPEIFHLWCGISAIAAILERGSKLDRGYYCLYPNLYIVLVSDSAVSRKTAALDIIKPFVREAVPNIHIIGHRDSPQGFIHILSKRYEETGVGAGYIIKDELVTFLKSSAADYSIVQVLTEAYSIQDSPLKLHTLKWGWVECENVCINLLAASTPEWIRDSLPTYAIEGGFTGRVIFVYQMASGKKIAHPRVTDRMRKLRKDLIEDLKEIRRINGFWVETPEAYEWFEDWYENVFKPDQMEPELKSYAGRKHDTLLKLSMIMAAARSSNTLIGVIDMEEALRVLNMIERSAPMIMRRLQTSPGGESNTRVMRTIQRKGEIRYSELLRSLAYCMNAVHLREVLDTLIAAEMVVEVEKEVTGKNGSKVRKKFYRMDERVRI